MRKGHPTVEELIAEQGLEFPKDPRELIGSFWPEDEPVDDFLKAFARNSRSREDVYANRTLTVREGDFHTCPLYRFSSGLINLNTSRATILLPSPLGWIPSGCIMPGVLYT